MLLNPKWCEWVIRLSDFEGVVIRSHGLFHDVRTRNATFRCTIRGRLKLDKTRVGGLVVGDRVTVLPEGPDVAVITAIHPRICVLSRRGLIRGQPDQIILANARRLLAVFAVADPAPRLRMLDRFLVLAAAHNLEATICATKIDLDPDGSAREPFKVYERCGYLVIYASARDGTGCDEIAGLISDEIVVLAGPSGVGKTSLVNKINGGTLPVGEISEATGKGRHTTRGARLIPVAGGYLADTAGIRALAMAGVDRENLDHYFIEFAPYLGRCRFANCVHVGELGCAVEVALAAGNIDPVRIESYRLLRERFDDD